MKVHVADQKQRRGDHGGDHAGAMRGHAAAGNHVPAGNQEHCAGSVQTGDQGGVKRILLRDHAAGLLVRRFAIRNASPNITSENKSKVAIAEGSGNCVSIPG